MDNIMHTLTIKSTTDGICTALNAFAYAAALVDDAHQKAVAENKVNIIEFYRNLSLDFSETYESFLRSIKDQFPEIHKLFVTDFYNGGVIDNVEDFLNTFKS